MTWRAKPLSTASVAARRRRRVCNSRGLRCNQDGTARALALFAASATPNLEDLLNRINTKHSRSARRIVTVALLSAMTAACAVDEEEGIPSLDPASEPDDAYGGKADSANGRIMPNGPAPAAFANQLTVFAIPSPRPAELSWDKPGKLVRRVLFNELGNMTGVGFHRTLGHAAVRIECEAPFVSRTGQETTVYQGSMTNVDSNDFNELLVENKIGLGMLFDNVDGQLEDPEVLEETLQKRYKNGRLSFLRIGISAETCAGLLAYVEAYDEANVQKNYGLAARPLYREGAGCSAFSMSFIELANLMEAQYVDEWSFSVRAPKELVGGSRNPNNQVGLWKLFWLTRGWADSDEVGFDVFGWDPTLMFHSIRAMAEDHVRAGGDSAEGRGRAIGLVLDRTYMPPSVALHNRTFFNLESL